MSCIFLDEEHFMTVDSLFELKLWNVNSSEECLSRSEILKAFDASSINLVNINRQFCAVHDKTKVHIYALIEKKTENGSYPFIEDRKEINFPDYRIKKILGIPHTEEGLFFILTYDSQLIFCRTKNQYIVWEYSLLNIPYISRFFDNPALDPSDISIPSSDIIINDSMITTISNQNFRESSSYQTHSSLMSQQAPQTKKNRICSHISSLFRRQSNHI